MREDLKKRMLFTAVSLLILIFFLILLNWNDFKLWLESVI